ncbi:MAG TPA: hypothetical protein PLF71_02625 [bacterium]|nr:MAG: hypothetical protein BWY14_00013 [Parcubacteria group bacterium ADurb.Bin192]HPN14987.1 hypothetical protein [bacterium]
MGGDNFEDLYRAETSIRRLILDGKRDPEQVLRMLQAIVDRPDFASVLDAPFADTIDIEQREDWVEEYRAFYAKVFKIKADLAGVEIPPEQPGFGWVVVIQPGLTLGAVWGNCRERFSAYSRTVDELGQSEFSASRKSDLAYAIRLRNRIEADEENKSLSANDLQLNEHQGITLLERLVLELWYHWKTGSHLDLVNYTLCAGSRLTDGTVPGVGWREGHLSVGRRLPNQTGDDTRSRSVV